MLLETKLQGLEVKRVEIGNEFYLSNVGYQERFATAQEYANLTTIWRNEIRNYLGNDMQICAVGSNNDYTGSTNNRRDTWNTNLFNAFSTTLPEAFSVHHYRNAGLSSLNTITNDYKIIYQKAIEDVDELNSYVNQFGGQNNTTPIWLTEYNLFDRTVPIHGTWYHGLYTAFSTLKFLENSRIKACNLHAQSGNYTFGNFFNETNGLRELGAFKSCIQDLTNSPPIVPPATQIYGKTSEGIAMEQIAIALKDAVQGKRIGFNALSGATIPTLNPPSNTEQALYGWVFDKYGVTNNTALILNLSAGTVNNVDVDQLGFNTQDINIQLSLSNPVLYATGFSRVNGNTTEYEFLTCGSNSNTFVNSLSFTPVNIPSSKLISLPPYSITRLEKINNQRLYLYALNDTVKAGSKVIVSLLNKDTIHYTWPNGNDSLPYFEFVAVADTTINLTYTTPGSLTTSTASKFIKVIQSPVIVSIISTSPITNNSIDYCPSNTPIQLTASVTGGSPTNYKYVWITTPTNDDFPDFNRGVGNTNTISVSPDYPTKYTVYVTDGVTVAKQSITINVPTAFNLKPSYTSCYNTDIEFEITKNAYGGVTYSYTWQGNNYTIIGNPVKFTIPQPNASLSNVVTVTATTPGCTNTKTATINFYNCCNTSSSLQIEPGSDINDLFDFFDRNSTLFTTAKNGDGQLKVTSLGAANSTHFIINGDLHIRDDASSGVFYTGLELINANVTFTEGASITVEPGFSLTLNNSNLDAECDQMWKGIIVDAANLKTDALSLNGTSIKNAEVAINSYPGSNLNIRRTNFENNVIGIEADHQSADGDNLQFFNIRANEFRGVGTLKAQYIGQTLPVGALPYSGMLLNRVNAEIGVPNSMGNPNEFSNLNAGIICSNSNLNIQNCDFSDILKDNAYLYPAGTSIFAVGNCKIKGDDLTMVKSQSQTFPSYGIFLLQGNDLNIQNSTFTNLERAIQNDWSNFKNYNISYNTFTDCKIGIEWWESNSYYSADIINNTFKANLNADNMPIQPDNEAIRIWAGTYNNFPLKISFNEIENHLVGIYAMGLNGKEFGQYIEYNTINLTLSESNIRNNAFDFRGISLQKCDYLNVKNNEISWTGDKSVYDTNVQGIRFEFCPTSSFSLNSLINMNSGFYGAGSCEETALTCNEMNECYPNGMFLDAADLPDQGEICGPNFNAFYGNYDPSVNSYLKLAGNVNGNFIKWYYQGTQLITNPLNPEPSAFNIVIPQLTSCNGPLPCGSAERYMGNMEQRSEYLDKIIADSIYYAQYPQENHLYDLEFAHTVMTEDSTFVINAVYEQFFQAIDQGNIGKLNEVRELLNSGEVNLAYIKNNTVLYQNVMEQNTKTVNEVLLNKLMSNTIVFDSLQKNTLTTIAYQPAMLGGKGVYNARSLLRLRIEDGASSLRTYSNSNNGKQNSNLIFAYPNPTHDHFNIKTNNAEFFDLKIKDLNGKVLIEKFGCNESTLFDSSNLPSGIYLLDLHFSNGKLEKNKLTIVR